MAAPNLITPLRDICVKVVAANFEGCPTFGPLPDKYVKRIIDILPLDLPLELVGSLIADEDYWRRRSQARWKNCEVAAHGYSWKQLFFERNLMEFLEQYDPAVTDLSSLKRLLTYSRRFVQTVHIRQLPSHLDLQILFECMVNTPSSLALSYNLKEVGMDYDRSLFGMKLSDCRALAKALEHTETLTHLDLSNNSLDDDKVRMLASGLVENLSITHLNLSHNKIADRGVRALAKLLDGHSVISLLELHDNQIHTEGAESLARAFKSNQCLLSVNLRLNRMGDEGCKAVVESVRGSPTLQRLNISANAAGPGTAAAVVALLRLNNTLTELDVSCNQFGEDACGNVRRALEQNGSVRLMDVRMTGINPDDEMAIAENLRARQERVDKARVLGK
uniref:Dynein regulatory complex subunit 5 n=1 Tax=Chlamydomonas reinhardtii TaxID=3055 RepID=DRC5_CHLRE|nr:RecName: Full=Dynein regulatory complex subunit 5; AltName: Full=Flagellar-associated protein 155 [Chlamydomonas reinhardtii]|eukprot:XP_001689724.1 flagellar associated protein [Chlamydomonas reinhardtii]